MWHSSVPLMIMEGYLSVVDLVAQSQTVRAAVEDAASQARGALGEAYQLV